MPFQRDLEFVVELGLDRNVPAIRSCEFSALHCIFLGHQHRNAFGFRQICLGERMMVRETPLFGDHPDLPQDLEEAARVADPGDGDHAPIPKGPERQLAARVGNAATDTEDELHCMLAGSWIVPVRDHQVHTTQTPRRLPQRTRGKTPAVALAPLAIHDADLQISSERVMLQTIVRQENIARP